jgi:type I site-specific restriction endonuclease
MGRPVGKPRQTQMKTINFEFLKPDWKALANIAGFAEQYVHADPASALVKLRQFCEQVVEHIYAQHGLRKPYQCSLNDLLQEFSFKQAVPRVVISKLQSLRVHGNKAAHGEQVRTQESRWLLQEAYDLAKWLVVTYSGADIATLPPFQDPEPPSTRDPAELRREKKAILERLAKQEAQTEKLLRELAAARQLPRTAEVSLEELNAAAAAGQQSANRLKFDEAATRARLIDSLLVSAGWNVGANGTSTDEVGQEVRVLHQPTDSGEGYADYALYRKEDGKTLAVIEAKKTAVDPEIGRQQAKLYADGIAAEQDGFRPIIFCTNGYETTIWNDANDEPPRQVFGFYSRDSLEYLLIQNQERKPADQIVVNTDITNRLYQIEAIKRVTERFAARHRRCLIDQFKKKDSGLNIVISIDMMDTGIDVPEVVNLVFAKPVYSYVKFWQMIGRGTRLCPGLFGTDENGKPKDKTHFQIFDHWGNFEYFDELAEEAEPKPTKSLLQRLFEARLDLADTALKTPDIAAFGIAAELISQDIADLPDKSISVIEKYKEVSTARDPQLVHQFAPATVAMLRQDLAPLMQYRTVAGDQEAYKFDMLLCRLETELLRGTARFDDYKADLLNQIARLSSYLNQVRAKAEIIARVKSAAFWQHVTVGQLEAVRRELRGIMKFRDTGGVPYLPPKVLDVTEVRELVEHYDYKPKLDGLELAQYRNRVESVLRTLFQQNEVLQRIKAGQPVSDDDLQSLVSLVLTQQPDLDLSDLLDYYPETAGHLDLAIRSIIGLDPEAVQERFRAFVHKHTTLNSMQLRFLQMLQNHIAKYGSIELERLYEEPFTSLSSDGVDGVFRDDQIDDLLEIIGVFQPPFTTPERPFSIDGTSA